MAKNTCLTRVESLLKGSSIKSVKRDEIINLIKQSIAEKKLSGIDEVNVDKIAKDVTEQIKAQKKQDKINALNDEILVRKKVEEQLENFKDDPENGLISLLVGTNELTLGARQSVGVAQNAAQGQLIAGFNAELKNAGVDQFFANADMATQERIAIAMEEFAQQKTDIEKRTGLKPPVTETNQDIKKVAEIMESYSELVRQKLNARGANIEKMWGYVVKQSYDQFNVRAAANRLNKKLEEITVPENLKGKDINYYKNFTAWKNFIMQYLDGDRTFAKIQIAEGAGNIFGTKNVAKGANYKRVLHYKSAKDWFAVNEKFGTGSLKETYFSGLMTAGRNMGMIDSLGTKPKQNFEKIRYAIQQRLIDDERLNAAQSISSYAPFDKYMKVVDGTIHTIEGGSIGFGVAKWSAITRAVGNVGKLGGAVISAAADLGIYGSEMKFQGRSFLGGMYEGFKGLARRKNTQDKKDLVEGMGFLADGIIYDVSGRHTVGDNLTKGWTRIQRTFFKYNLLSWWTNTLKENSMLGMANYYAKQKNLSFDKLNKPLQEFFGLYNIDSVKWDVIRKNGMAKADDGTEFINVANLDQISDADIKRITGIDNLSKTELQIEKDKFKYSVSGILLDRSIYAVIEPDARVKGIMTQGLLAGTGMGEAIRFVGQFKAFPMSIMNKVLGREMAYIRKGKRLGGLSTEAGRAEIGRGIRGMAALIITSGFMGYMAMTMKDLLKGKEPRDPTKFKTIMAGFLQGGGLGIYGDVLFKEQRDAGSVIAGLVGPAPTTAVDLGLALQYALLGEGGKSAKAAYRAISSNIPFLNLFYIKVAFDYLIGFQIMETLNPGVLKRVERRMKKDYNQEYLFTKPSTSNKGF